MSNIHPTIEQALAPFRPPALFQRCLQCRSPMACNDIHFCARAQLPITPALAEPDDPTPYCTHCGPRSACDCGPIAENE